MMESWLQFVRVREDRRVFVDEHENGNVYEEGLSKKWEARAKY